MKKLLCTILLCSTLLKSFSQKQRPVSLFLSGEYNKTLYDATAGNNPWGIGLGMQLFLNSNSNLKFTADFTADTYFEDDKVARLNPNGTVINNVGGMVNLFAGASLHPTDMVYLSFVAGPSFINQQTLLGVKPSIGFYFSPNQRWTGKFSFINIYKRDKLKKADFGSFSLSVGVRLF